ncbi:MAG: sodium-dependent transporter [Rikenellaceae bacterium]
MKQTGRGNFNSRFGVMMAVAGSAVGLGNVWRFPYLAGQNGGGAFFIIYIALVFLIGLPIILSEFSIGQAAGAGPMRAFRRLEGKKKTGWTSIGYISVIIGLILLGYYCVVAGWVFKFLTQSIFVGFEGQSVEQISAVFTDFTSSTWEPIAYALAFIVVSALIVRRGIDRGIEQWSKILMPSLFVMLVLLCINSMTLEGWDRGIDFLFNPDWSKVTGQTFVDALGQVFFTLSIGMGVMITYGSYTSRGENMFASKATSSIIDTSVAILSGLIIFPAVFTFGLEAGQGPELVFLTLPSVFAQMPFGGVLSALFFAMLSIAALTSAISIHELLVTTMIEQLKVSRKRAALITTLLEAGLIVVCALSSYCFDLFDYLSANVLMPLCGLLVVVYAGWIMSPKKLRSTFTSDGKYSRWIYPIFIFIVRYIAPLAIALIFLNGFGLI